MYNKIFLIGRVVNDPTLKYSQQGKAVSTFSIAVDRQDETDFFDLVSFDKQAEVASKYLTKGRLIMVEGRLQTRTFETQDGTKRKVYEIIIDSFRMLDKRQEVEKKEVDKKIETDKKFDTDKKYEFEKEKKYEKYEKKPYKVEEDFGAFEEDEIIEEKPRWGQKKSEQPYKSKNRKVEEEDFDDFFFDEN